MQALDLLAKSYFETGNFQFIVDSVKRCKQEKEYSFGISLLAEYLKVYPNSLILRYELASFLDLLGQSSEAFQKYNDLLQDRSTTRLAPLFLTARKKLLSTDRSLLSMYTEYPTEIVQRILNRKNLQPRFVTLTMTTCKRFPLFQQTMNSFLSCCTDLDLIDRWICIDDNSSQEDREKMKNLYPFFEFIFKSPQEKGHPQSMNRLVEVIKTPFFFHLEDDWKFFQKLPYITQCMEVLTENPKYGQCLVNKNFSETENDVILGGEPKITDSGLRYVCHEFCPTDELQKEFTRKNGFGAFVHYWPHFSLRPGLCRTSIFSKLGRFDEKVSHFERVFAQKYYENGFVTVFLEDLYSIHIGRLTSERDDQTKLNAYILNGEKQFSGKESEQKEDKKLSVRTFVINLDRRPDRWEKFQKQPEPTFLRYLRVSAVDGNALVPTEQLQQIFEGNDYNMRAGMVGCAMSHIKLYIDLLNSKEDVFCILEDDIQFCNDFQNQFIGLITQLAKTDWDFCYLGHHVWGESEFKLQNSPSLKIEKRSAKDALEKSIGGTGGYLITRTGAEKLLNFINSFGMRNGIDTIQQKSADLLNVYYCSPHLIYSECWTNNSNSDTDIQKEYKSLTIPVHVRLANLKEFFQKYNPKQSFDFTETLKFVTSLPDVPLVETDTKVLIFISGKPTVPNNPRSVEYEKSEIELIKEKCIHPCFSLEHRVLFIVQNPTVEIRKNRFFDRLKIFGEFNVDSALSIPSFPQDLVVIPIGEMTHITEAVPKVSNLPFNKMDGLTLESVVKLTQIVLEMDLEQLRLFTTEFCSPSVNTTYLQKFNNKTVVRNEKFAVSFPHDDLETIVVDYTVKFSNYVSLLKHSKQIKMVFGMRFPEDLSALFSVLVRSIRMVNPSVNLEILSINGQTNREPIPEVRTVMVPFPDKFNGPDWSEEKIQYDQSKFRIDVQKPILEFIRVV